MYKKILVVLATAATLLTPKIVLAQSFADTPADEHGIQLINTESQSVYLSRIYRENDVVEFWMETSSGSFDTEEHVSYVASCVAPVATAVGGYTYNHSLEQVQARWTVDEVEVGAVQPGSVLEAAIQEACNFN